MLDILKKNAWWLVPLLLFDVWFFHWLAGRTLSPASEEAATQAVVAAETEPAPPPPPPVLEFITPTEQTNLWDTESAVVYQPPASGRVSSALYGSVRTRSSGGSTLPHFHEGIDIAPMRRDARGTALDEIRAVADGRVGHINRVGGNSTYGVYVVLLHDDPLGEIYTLYAHLASVAKGLKAGDAVARGTVLGVMGHTASTGIPKHRSHLHFEIGVMSNSRFQTWYNAQKLTPDHGRFHGGNLLGVNPLALYRPDSRQDVFRFSLLDHLSEAQPAFNLLIRQRKPLDYFERHPALWQGEAYQGHAMILEVCEGGVPKLGRNATAEEAALLGSASAKVLEAFPEALGRNGLRLVVPRKGEWTLGEKGRTWLQVLTY